MEMAVHILTRLEAGGCKIRDTSWKHRNYGNLVEVGIEVECDRCVIALMCSYEDIHVARIAGNKAKYHEIREAMLQKTNEGA